MSVGLYETLAGALPNIAEAAVEVVQWTLLLDKRTRKLSIR